MKKTILSFGETLWDLLPTGPVLGGAPCNFAYRMNALGDRALLVSRLGKDDWGKKAMARLAALGMETKHVQWDERHATGTVPIALHPDGSADYTILPDVAYDYIEATDDLLREAAAADGICFGSLSQRAPGSRRTLHRLLDAAGKGIKVLDVNLRKDCHTPETLKESLARADILKLNDQEVRPLADLFRLSASVPEFCRALIEQKSLTHAVVTLGERGAFAASAKGDQVYDPGYRVPLVDTVGSGDAFTAGFVHLLLREKPLRECVRFGNVLGAMVAAQAGATGPTPPGEIERFKEQGYARVADPELRRHQG